VVNNVVLYTALFDVTNDGQLMPQMSAQVFFVRASAHDVVTVPVAALQFGRVQGGAGQRGGGRGQGRSGQPSDQLPSGEDQPKGRPATVTVVNEDGSTETRDVVVGVSDRVTAAILSGLSEGEQVVAGTGVGAARAGRGANAGRQPGVGPGFGGLR
jgi:macrolide-specific efflux system membrane fusion protein